MTIENTIPNAKTLASGAHIGSFITIIGTTPMAAAIVVKNIGLNLLLADSVAASFLDKPSVSKSSSLYSTIITPFRITIPHNAIRPTKAVKLNTLPVIIRPSIDPNNVKGIEIIIINGRLMSLKTNSKIIKIITKLIINAITISPKVLFLLSMIPPYSN